jgi:hypothetical protein
MNIIKNKVACLSGAAKKREKKKNKQPCVLLKLAG